MELSTNALTVLKPHCRAGKDAVARACLPAFEKGLKGITAFRYGPRRGTLVRFTDVG